MIGACPRPLALNADTTIIFKNLFKRGNQEWKPIEHKPARHMRSWSRSAVDAPLRFQPSARALCCAKSFPRRLQFESHSPDPYSWHGAGQLARKPPAPSGGNSRGKLQNVLADSTARVFGLIAAGASDTVVLGWPSILHG